MAPRRRNSLLAAGCAGVLGAGLLFGWARAGSDEPGPRAGLAAAPASNPGETPRSCKPSSPVSIAFQSGASDPNGTWRLELRALEATPEVHVFMGSGPVGQEPRSLVWRGALAAGEVRQIEVQLAAATGVWAEADVPSAGGGAMRSLAVRGGGFASSAARSGAQRAGRLVVDPRTGESTYEFTGEVRR